MALRDRLLKRGNAPTVATVATVAVANIKKEDTAIRQENRLITPQPLPVLDIPLENNKNEQIHKINILSYARDDISDKNTFATATVATLATVGGGDPKLQASGQSERPSCFSCGFFNGKGSYWPGRCNLDGALVEIDFNVVDVAHGCQCYTARPVPRVVHSVERQRLKGDDPGWIRGDEKVNFDSSKLSRPPHSLPKIGGRISPVALEWLREHRQELRDKGWTARGLYRRNLSRGICWSDVWDMPGLSVVIESTGCLCFEFKEATGRKVKQTAWPMKQRAIKKEKIK